MSFDGVRQALLERLEDCRAAVVARLDEVGGLDLHPEVEAVDCVLFVDPERYELDIELRCVDAAGEEVVADAVDGEVFFSGSTDLLEAASFLDPPETTADEDECQAHLSRLGLAIVEWFASCWQESAGPQLPVPCYARVEDDARLLDLKTLEWTTFEEAFPGE